MSHDDQLAERVLEAHARFEAALHRPGPFPEDEFEGLFQAVWRYAEATKGQERVHRKVAATLYGLGETLRLEALQVPGKILTAVDRLGALVFAGYDPQFKGHEPPGL
ncbi:MAG TPA: hypothetical protein VKA46_31280 [Gemmataceae bacterium]|nr:hypothetical protein [Gemmataceae bacterium]